MKAVFLDLATTGPDDLDLDPLLRLPVSWDMHAVTRPEQLDERIDGREIVISNKCPLPGEVLARHPGIGHISAAATGYNHIDVAAARRLGITVSNVRDYATGSVVQHVYALILALTTRLLDYRAAVAAGAWQASPVFCLLDYPIEELSGKTLGIIGYGTLGRAVAAAAPALGLEVVVAQHLEGPADAGRLALDDLLALADVVSLHLPLTVRTRHLIGARELALMKPGALLVNTARGGIVDEQALVNALRSQSIGGAGIDVLSCEPPVDDNPLLAAELGNLIVTPHIAWASRKARQTLIEELGLNVAAYLCGETRNPVI